MVKKNETQKSETTNVELRFKGVRKRKWGKYVSEIRLPKSRERIWLGSYDSAEKAARAFDAALFCLRGGAAKFNFPANPPEIEGGRSLTPAQIQEAAARFANSASSESQSEESSTSGFQTESPSPSVSTETVELDSWRDLELDGPFLDLLGMGSGNFRSDFGMFPGFDDISNDFLGDSTPVFDFGEENFDVSAIEGSFLWNF